MKSRFAKQKSKDAFQDFQEMTSDAWDGGDEDFVIFSSSSSNSLGKKKVNKVSKLSNNKQNSKSANNDIPVNQETMSQKIEKLTLKPNINDKHIKQISKDKKENLEIKKQYESRPENRKTISNLSLKDSHESKGNKFSSIINSSTIDLDELRKLSWSGVPKSQRPQVWKLLSGYLPGIKERQDSMLSRKRGEYHIYVQRYYITRYQEVFQDIHRQIQIDLPRMCPSISLFQQPICQEIFERILYIWAIRHPASGYVQGMNDLLTPFFVVFLAEHLPPDTSLETCKLSSLDSTSLQQLEPDCYWCFSKLLDGIQDYYTFAQPGIQMKINKLKDLVHRIDAPLHRHLENHKVEYIQFSFRWMNNLLMRELPLPCIILLWDAYLSEKDGFAQFHLYVCAAFLTRFSSKLQKQNDFHSLMVLLQNLPTQHWGVDEVREVLAEAFKLKYSFADAPKHYTT